MNDLKSTIEEIFNVYDKSDQPVAVINQANSVESLATDIYSENSRFVYELIQNADDAMTDPNGIVEIKILAKHIIISHNGKAFTSRDVRGLCAIGLGTKTKNSDKTGYKGIGFKSVFGQPDGLVYVQSEKTLFRFDREHVKRNAWKPEWGNQSAWEAEYEPFKAPWQMMPILSQTTGYDEVDNVLRNPAFSVKTAIRIRDPKSLWNDVSNLFKDLNFLLFLRKINSITFSFLQTTHTIQKKRMPGESKKFMLSSDGDDRSSWVVKPYTLNIPEVIKTLMKDDTRTPDKIRQQTTTEISIAVKVNDKNQEVIPLKDTNSPIYSYLPTSITEFNFPFLVNGNFLLDASRQNIQKDRAWNSWLFLNIGILSAKLCSEVAQNSKNSKHLKLLPNAFYSENSILYTELNKGLKAGLDVFPVFNTPSGKLVKAKEVVLDPFNLGKLDLNLSDAIGKKINQSKHVLCETKDNKHLRNLGSKRLSHDDLLRFLASNHLQRYLEIENNIVILRLIKKLSEDDKDGKWEELINNTPLIVTDQETIQQIKRVCYPGKIPADVPDHYRQEIIHSNLNDQILNDPELKNWLDSLGVRPPSIKAYLEKEIIANLPDSVDETNHLDIISFLYSLHETNELTETHYNALQNIKILTQKNTYIKAKKCCLSPVYSPPIDITLLNNVVPLVHETYSALSNPSQVGRFLMKIGVAGDITIPVEQNMLASELPKKYVQESFEATKSRSVYPHLIGIYYLNPPKLEVTFFIQTIPFLEHTTIELFSKQFWNRLFQKHTIEFLEKKEKRDDCTNTTITKNTYTIDGSAKIRSLDKMNWGRRNYNIISTPSYLQWWATNNKCIPTKRGLKTAPKAFQNSQINVELAGNYLSIVDLPYAMSDTWASFLGVQRNLSVSELLKIYGRIVESMKKSGYLKAVDRTRIGSIFNELVQQLNKDFEDTLNRVKEWAATSELFSASENTKRPESLLWFDSPSFIGTELDSVMLLVPNNVDRNNSAFKTLIQAFGVNVVEKSEFRPAYPVEHFDLKIKLIEILPYLTLLLVKRLTTGEFERELRQRLTTIEKTKFLKCQSLDVVITHEGKEITGSSIESHYSIKQNIFFWDGNWNSRVFIQRNIDQIATLLGMHNIEKDLSLLLTFTDNEWKEFLEKEGCDIPVLQDSEAYADTRNAIESLRPTREKQKFTSTTQTDVQITTQKIPSKELGDKSQLAAETNQSPTRRQNEKFYDEEEEAMLSKLFGDNISVEQRNDANIEAHVKGLIYCKHCGYDTSKAEEQFLHNLNNGKYLHPVIDNGKELKVMCRSATSGILYLGAYAWRELQETDTILYILIGDSHSDHKIAENPQQVESHDADYWILRREITPDGYTALDQILSNETEIDKLQILFHVGNTEYANIFKFSKNSRLENVPGNYGNEDEF